MIPVTEIRSISLGMSGYYPTVTFEELYNHMDKAIPELINQYDNRYQMLPQTYTGPHGFAERSRPLLSLICTVNTAHGHLKVDWSRDADLETVRLLVGYNGPYRYRTIPVTGPFNAPYNPSHKKILDFWGLVEGYFNTGTLPK